MKAATLLDRAGLLLLAAMVSLPMLHPLHRNPIPSFWAEWWAVALGLLAAACLLIRPSAWQAMVLPRITLLPLIVALVCLVQISQQRVFFVEPALLQVGMLLWAALLIITGRLARERFGFDGLADVLAVALLVSALLNSLIVLLQIPGIDHSGGGWVFASPGGASHGNLGQPNHLNHVLWLGLASAMCLHLRGRIGLMATVIAMAVLLFASTLSASRSILLYALLLTTLGWLFQRRAAAPATARRAWQLCLPLLPAVALMQWAHKHLLSEWFGLPGATAYDRLFLQVSGFDQRLRLWHAAWQTFIDSPWLGAGAGSLPWQLFSANEHMAENWRPGVAEHVHNLFLQLLAEFGLVATIPAVLLLALWLWSLRGRTWTPAGLWMAAILCIGFVHSQLEYPLWYAFFLGITALLLGAADAAGPRLATGVRGAALAALVLAAAAVPLNLLRLDYQKLGSALDAMAAPQATTETRRRAILGLLDMEHQSLIFPHVLATLAATMTADRNQLPAKLDLCQRAMHFAPANNVVFKCGLLLALAGRDVEARLQTVRAMRAFPGDIPALLSELRASAPLEPKFTVLLDAVETEAKITKAAQRAPAR